MRKEYFLLVSLLFAELLTFGQNVIEKQKILEATHVEALKALSADLKVRYTENKARALAMAKIRNWPVRVELEDGRIMELHGITMNDRPIYYTTDNWDAAATISTNKVQPGGSAGLNLDGEGYTLGEWDGGAVLTTHQEFNNTGVPRVTQKDSQTETGSHATHVAGTLVAGGVVSSARGMAFRANLSAYDWDNDNAEMSAEAAGGLLISSHSYGEVSGWYDDGSGWEWYGNPDISTEEDWKFGFYDASAQVWDNIANNAPYYLIVKSAGNDRGDGPSDGEYPVDGGTDGYDCISTYGNAKNILTIGAVYDLPEGYTGNPADVILTDYSSRGPADDGRIKPDIVANGTGLYSTNNTGNTDYSTKSGTSMATPSVAGSLLLLQQHFNESHGTFMRSSTLKGLVIHTADEAGPSEGPDYNYGWGLMNTQQAARVISDKDISSIIIEESLLNGATYTLDVNSTGIEALKVTLAWNDPYANVLPAQLDPTTPMLVNDLDMTVSNGESTYYPYVLNPGNPSAAATTGDNDVDNVEKILIDSPGQDTWTITINHEGNLTGPSQVFSLIVTGISNGRPVVLTSEVSNITSGSATVSGEVVSNSGYAITERGIVYSTSPLPTTSDHKAIAGAGLGTFSANLNGLLGGTEYFARAYAINSQGVSYGSQISFFTDCTVATLFPYTQDFSDNELPVCWQNIDNIGSGQAWEFDNPGEQTVNTTTSYNGFAILDSDHYGIGNSQDAELVSPIFDFTGLDTVQLQFEHYFRSWSSSAGALSYSIDGGSSWNPLQTWTSSTANAETHFADLSNELKNQANARLRWVYTGTWGYYWAIDDIVVTATGQTYAVTFHVDDGIVPVENAVVTLEGYGSEVTNSSGEAVFTGIPAKPDIAYYVSAEGFFDYTGSVTLTDSDITENISLDLYAFSLTFQVSDGMNPVEGATVSLTDYGEQTTNAEGEAVFNTVVPALEMPFLVQAAGFDPVAGVVDMIDRDTIKMVVLGGETYNIFFTVDDGTDSIEGATVNLEGYGIRTTDVSGQVSYEGVSIGMKIPYHIVGDGFEPYTDSVNVIDSDVTIDVTLQPVTYDVIFHVSRGAIAIEGATITLQGYETVLTGFNGIAIVPDVLPAQDIYYSVEAAGHVPQEGTVSIENSNKHVYITLTQVLYDLTFLVDDGMDPIESASITLDGHGNQFTDNSGEAVFIPVTPMIDIDYSIYAEGFSEYTGTVMVVEESQVEIVHLSPSNLQYSEESANYVLLYPNPTNGILHIKAAKEMPVKLRIFDMTGSRIFDEFVYDGSVIRMDHYGKGIYHFEMQIRDEIIHETVIRK